MNPQGSSARVALQFVGMAFAWGASFLFMKVALDGMTWGQVAWARILIGAITMLVIVLIMRERMPRDLKLWGQLAAISATICYGFTGGYLRKFVTSRGISAPMVAFGQVGTAAVLMLVLSPVLLPGPLALNGWIVVSMLSLGIFGTGLAFLWNINVMRAWGPTRNSTVTYLTPIIGVALGVLILGEQLSWNEPVGAVIAIIGILVMRQRSLLRRPRRLR